MPMNANKELERLHWLEQAIAAGRDEPWIYYHAAELASALGKTEKANRYLRIAIARGWQQTQNSI